MIVLADLKIVLVEAEGVTKTVLVVVLGRRVQVVVVETSVVVVILGRRVQVEIVLDTSDCCKKVKNEGNRSRSRRHPVKHILRGRASPDG